MPHRPPRFGGVRPMTARDLLAALLDAGTYHSWDRAPVDVRPGPGYATDWPGRGPRPALTSPSAPARGCSADAGWRWRSASSASSAGRSGSPRRNGSRSRPPTTRPADAAAANASTASSARRRRRDRLPRLRRGAGSGRGAARSPRRDGRAHRMTGSASAAQVPMESGSQSETTRGRAPPAASGPMITRGEPSARLSETDGAAAARRSLAAGSASGLRSHGPIDLPPGTVTRQAAADQQPIDRLPDRYSRSISAARP